MTVIFGALLSVFCNADWYIEHYEHGYSYIRRNYVESLYHNLEGGYSDPLMPGTVYSEQWMRTYKKACWQKETP